MFFRNKKKKQQRPPPQPADMYETADDFRDLYLSAGTSRSSSSSSSGNRRPSCSSNNVGPPNFKLPDATPLRYRTSPSLDTHSNLLDKPWRTLNWSERNDMKKQFRSLKAISPEVEYLRILVHGPVAAGKSSFINSIDSIFMGRMTNGALAATANNYSFSKKTFYINDELYGHRLPFTLCDTMGLEEGQSQGALTEDLVNILKGHIRDGYMFNPVNPCSEADLKYNSSPRFSERVHCLVSVVPATSISMIADDVIEKMRAVREKASFWGIPQVVVLTKVEEMCPQVAEDIKLVYRSKRIRLKMEECSGRLGIPLNCIFPVKNYSEEINLVEEVDVLLLSALKHAVNFASDHVANTAPPPGTTGHNQPVEADVRSMERDDRFTRSRPTHAPVPQPRTNPPCPESSC